LRDLNEANRMINRMEEARTEKLSSAERAWAQASTSRSVNFSLGIARILPCNRMQGQFKVARPKNRTDHDQAVDVVTSLRSAVLGPVLLGT
jgi:hypothetical protein